MATHTKYVKRAKALGAKNAKIIPAKSVATAEWVRLKCQFGCGVYGSTLVCPPNSPRPEETESMLTHYKRGLLIHGHERIKVKDVVVALERKIFLDGYHKAFGMGSGPCHLCSKKCPKSCRHPGKARPAMEACGIDVFTTVRANGFPIEALNTKDCQGNYYGLVLIE